MRGYALTGGMQPFPMDVPHFEEPKAALKLGLMRKVLVVGVVRKPGKGTSVL